ncbi:hypothetical protein [Alicyclobacillus fastidiosus]|uniref:hypothetical protein n=1 Tax=Alicyclobacillus fastidiosus TaxID=392011 RepID=UPI0023E945D9|nr:hypothetical protein [Alicyclobacillus fastidiosus]GMA61924.1 hypothetical protein GCM10025859_23640 [Alicyclobacillus fastidiosus]
MALVKRVLLMLFLIWLTVTATFFLIRLIPGNPIIMQLNQFVQQGMTYEAALRKVNAMYNIKVNAPLSYSTSNTLGDYVTASWVSLCYFQTQRFSN